MVASRLTDERLLADPRYIAEPKLDGQRAQVHIEGGRTVACYSRPGRELIALPGLVWLRTLRWPVSRAVLDGELFSGGGSDGIDAILAARQRNGSDTAFAAFDLLSLDGQEVVAEPWTDRRKRLEDVFAAGISEPRLQLVPVSDDAARLWTVWVIEWGGEGIVLKDRRSTYKPGARSRCWWKAKNKMTLTVNVLHCAPELVAWGDWGRAAVMAFAYRDTRWCETTAPND
jgi:bifunctional non-homologous end joining protein LigD